MPINIHGGGARTNEHGLRFEQDTSLVSALRAAGYAVRADGRIFMGAEMVAIIASKHSLYARLLEPEDINWKDYLSKQLLPDDALYNFERRTVYIVEKKFQHRAGSVDEKLQTCDFKKKQYQKLFAAIGYTVEYLYVCNDWFRQPMYRDVINYIHSVGCHIFFNEIPLDFLGLTPVLLEE